MKNLILVILAIGMAGCTTIPMDPCAQRTPAPVEWVQTKTGRTIVFNSKDFIKKPGAKSLPANVMSSMATGRGAKKAEPMEYVNGFVIDGEPGKRLAMSALSTNDGWVTQPEYKYTMKAQLYELVPRSCPTPGPIDPGPGPNPNPNPNPTTPAKSWGVTRMKATEAQAKVDTSNVVVCIVDTGLDVNHPCAPVIAATKSFTGEPFGDGAGHGTHVAGTVAGKCGYGVSQAKVAAGKGLMNNGSGSSTSLTNAGLWCRTVPGVKVASFSWGSPQNDPMIAQMVQTLAQSGIAVVIANGNDSRGTLNFPAQSSIGSDMIFGIAASDERDGKASFSTYGNGTDWIAPGTNIISLLPGGGFGPMSGTSMATPGVAGALAFCAAMNKPFSTCLKTDNLGLSALMQGKGLPNLWATVQ